MDVISRHEEKFCVTGLSAGGGNISVLAQQIAAVRPARVALPSEEAAAKLRAALTGFNISTPMILVGPQASAELAGIDADVVLNAITGYAGLEPTLAALKAGSTLALANKESLVVGGKLVTQAASPGQIVPVDSEHSAFAQALRSGREEEVKRLILTASGGPFRGRTRDQLRDVTVADALAHPTWNMGRVVTINSSTLVNKGLELIEAALLFSVPWDKIQVVVHPGSIVHSMVEFVDGSTIAQCSPPDMRLPIALGLSWPDRLDNIGEPCDWSAPRTWTFEPLDATTFPAVELARKAGELGQYVPTVFNAANEVCVDAFCESSLGFLGIVDTVSAVVDRYISDHHSLSQDTAMTLEGIREADAWARACVVETMERTQ